MMPGENQAKTAGVAPDGTAGTCQNCAVLNETLHEYMTSFLTLKQKIIETDKILNEFKEKRDDLQNTQRENAELHRHLDELLSSVAPFDNLHKDDVCMQEELQTTKDFLKRCQDGSADRNPEAQTLKDRIIFQLKILQDSNLKQSTDVTALRNENKALEYKLQKTQEKLGILGKELNKEKKSTGVQTEKKELCSTDVQTEVSERSSTAMQTDWTHMTSVRVQTDPTEESMMDLRKIRDYVSGLWHCVQPQPLSGTPPVFGWRSLPPEFPPSQANVPVPKERLRMSPVRVPPTAVPRTPPKSPARTTVRTPVKSPKRTSVKAKTPEGISTRGPMQLSGLSEKSPSPAEEILDLFRWLPPLLSPIHSPVHQRSSVEEDLQLSEEEEEAEARAFKQEDVKDAKEVFLSNGLKTSSRVVSPDSLPDVKFHQISPTNTQCPSTEKKADTPCLPPSICGNKRILAPAVSTVESPVGTHGGGEEERAAIISDDEAMESEVVMSDVKPSPDPCGDVTADMEWDPSAVDGPSCPNLSPNQSQPAAGSATDTHHSFGSTDTNGMELHNAGLNHSPLNNDPVTLKPVKHIEMAACNGHLHEEQISRLKPSLTDLTSTLTPQVKDQVVEISSICTGKVVGSEPLNGLVNGHHLEEKGLINSVRFEMEQNGHGNQQESIDSRFRKEQKQNPPKHIHAGSSRVTDEEGQNGHHHHHHHHNHQTPTDAISSSDSSKEVCGAPDEKPHEVVCVDTESSEDLDFRTPRRKLRVAHLRRESQQPVEITNGSSGLGETKETPSKGSSTNIQSPNRPVKAGGTVIGSAVENSELVTNTKKNDMKQSRVDLKGEVLRNGFIEHNPPAEESQVDTQAEVDQETQEKCNGRVENHEPCGSDSDTAHRPGITNGIAPAKHSADGVVHTNGAASPKQSPDGAVHTNGFGGPDSPSENKGSYTRVKGLEEPLRHVAIAHLMSPVDSVHNIRSMMGPPLRPLLPPLMTTPPKQGRALIGRGASQDGSEGAVTMPSANLALRNGPQKITFSPAVPTTPSPCKSVPSSPLQFGSATPKHAVPVPCRHPVSALNPASPAGPAPSQENSMQMLDSMYPELSAQARTLNILRGNVCNLVRPGPVPEPSTPPQASGGGGGSTHAASSGFNSVTTAFTKTQLAGKRCGGNVLLPKSAKKLRLGNSPVTVGKRPPSDLAIEPLPNGSTESKEPQNQISSLVKSDLTALGDSVASSKECVISQALAKLADSCFDLLVVVKSHVFVKRISSVPIMRDEEKEVVADFCTKNKLFTEDFLSAILAQLKAERTTMGGDRLQSLCRVYTALCRQNKDQHKANTLAYSLLKEDFPEAAKLVLFLVSTWPTLLTPKGALSRAIHAVAHSQAQGDVLQCLSHYLHWDSNPPSAIPQLINSTMTALRSGEKMQFQHHSRHGDDLCSTSWEYIFTLDLLCAHQKWKWTHDNIIRNDLWPIMNAWVAQSRTQKGPIQDVTVAAVLRLIGRLGQLGVKEKYSTAVHKMASVINMLGKQGQSEGVSWEVQLAAAYAIYDLSPSNPKEALAALAEWRGEATGPVPPAITSCLTQISSLCRKLSS